MSIPHRRTWAEFAADCERINVNPDTILEAHRRCTSSRCRYCWSMPILPGREAVWEAHFARYPAAREAVTS